ncbi:MAG: thioesterase family protein [Dokdonella sp.]
MSTPRTTPRKRTAKNPAAAALETAGSAPVASAAAIVATAAPSATAVPLASVPLAVRWGDLDAFNHVNNATFLVYVQEARLAWLAQIEGAWFDETMMPVVAAVQMNYRRQLAWPAQIVVELAPTRVGNSSLTIAHRILAADDPSCVYADGDVVMVWIDPSSGRSVALPDAIRSACQSSAEALAATTSK